MKQADRLTTVAGARMFVLTLWTASADPAATSPLYLGISPEQAEELVTSLQDWLKRCSIHHTLSL
jgi:hypothetical protein